MRGPVAEIELSTGDGNRLDAAANGDLCAAAAMVTDRAQVRVVIVSGAGRSFCEGAAEARGEDGSTDDGVAAIAGIAVPTIALLQGHTSGLGLALALACDLRCASRDAQLSVIDPVRGVVATGGGLARLPRLIGPARATEMALLGRTLSAATALSWGLVTQVVPRAGLRTTALRLAKAMAARGPLGMRYAKEAVSRALDLSLDDGIRLEQDLYVLLQTTADRREGVAAFRGRRPPRFHGR